MAHFAKLNSNNEVVAVNVVNNDVATDETTGINFLKNLYGSDTVWKQTSYNTFEGQHLLGGTPLRKNYAGIGYTYDSGRDAFIPPQPYSSWIIDEVKCIYVAPVTYPTIKKYTDENGNEYKYLIDWDEDNLRWDATDTSSGDNHYYWDASGLSWTSYTP